MPVQLVLHHLSHALRLDLITFSRMSHMCNHVVFGAGLFHSVYYFDVLCVAPVGGPLLLLSSFLVVHRGRAGGGTLALDVGGGFSRACFFTSKIQETSRLNVISPRELWLHWSPGKQMES